MKSKPHDHQQRNLLTEVRDSGPLDLPPKRLSNRNPRSRTDDLRSRTSRWKLKRLQTALAFFYLLLSPALSIADETALLQHYLTNRVKIPAGTYTVDPNTGLWIPSNSTVDLRNVVINVLPTLEPLYGVINVYASTNVTIIKGVVNGERHFHEGESGEWGMGIMILHSHNINVLGTTIYDCWGDGIYISGFSTDITITSATCDGNRRQGISVISGSNILIRSCTCSNTSGTLPSCGINIEPNRGDSVSNCTISDCTIFNNAGGGIQAGVSNADIGESFVRGTRIYSNRIFNNGCINPPHSTIHISNCENTQVLRNILRNNTGTGIGLFDSTNTVIHSNIAKEMKSTSNMSDAGILLSFDNQTAVYNNRITDNQGWGIFVWHSNSFIGKNTLARNLKGNTNIPSQPAKNQELKE